MIAHRLVNEAELNMLVKIANTAVHAISEFVVVLKVLIVLVASLLQYLLDK